MLAIETCRLLNVFLQLMPHWASSRKEFRGLESQIPTRLTKITALYMHMLPENNEHINVLMILAKCSIPGAWRSPTGDRCCVESVFDVKSFTQEEHVDKCMFEHNYRYFTNIGCQLEHAV